jgi:hypothetical protein
MWFVQIHCYAGGRGGTGRRNQTARLRHFTALFFALIFFVTVRIYFHGPNDLDRGPLLAIVISPSLALDNTGRGVRAAETRKIDHTQENGFFSFVTHEPRYPRSMVICRGKRGWGDSTPCRVPPGATFGLRRASSATIRSTIRGCDFWGLENVIPLRSWLPCTRRPHMAMYRAAPRLFFFFFSWFAVA